MSKPRIVLFDIETAPNEILAWNLWETDALHTTRPWYVLSFAMKVLGERRVQTFTLADYPNYKKDLANDGALLKDLWKMFDAADIVIAHNGDKFDIKKARARFAIHKMGPPSPVKSIDTLKIARSCFSFGSNKLGDLAQFLKVGRKLPHTGIDMWLGCMAGDTKSWHTMRRYNAHDVELLELVYLELRGWTTNHPKLNHYTRDDEACPTCLSHDTIRRGELLVKGGLKPRIKCKSCGQWFVGAFAKYPKIIPIQRQPLIRAA